MACYSTVLFVRYTSEVYLDVAILTTCRGVGSEISLSILRSYNLPVNIRLEIKRITNIGHTDLLGSL